MEAKNVIYSKLEAFIRKYYTNELLRGTIFFIGLGLLYFIFTLLVEYFLWLSSGGRTTLFWLFITVEVFLLFRFILFPIFKLFKLQKGIDYTQASQIIGRHFSEINDKLTNFLQLSSQGDQSELLLASIEQKADNLQPVPFTNAVNFKKNVKYIPYAAIPVLLILFFMISGNSAIFTQSLDRVVHYGKHYAPPAPFEFIVINNSLTAQQDTDFILEVKTQGNVVPENAMITIGKENYYLENVKPGVFQYRFEKPAKNIEFQLNANDVTSQPYQLNVVAVPTIANFEMVLNFPLYLGRKSEVVKGSGNAVVPEGTKVIWKVNALATTSIEWAGQGQIFSFANNENTFSLSKSIMQNTEYQILTSNNKVKHHEKLQYQLTTIKDQHPTISVSNAPDSLKLEREIILGQISDDYGLTKLQIVYYPQDNPEVAKRGTLPVKKDVYDRFYYTFPNGLTLQQGVNYEYYFEVFDNDAVHNYKSAKSSVFSHREKTQEEKREEALQDQNSNINSLEKSIKNQDKQIGEMDKLQKMGKEKDNMDFKDQKKVQDFINRQKQQDEMMKEFSKKLEDNLEKFNPEKKDEFKEELMKRLEKNQKEAEKNKKLLDELKDLANKLKKEELFDKVDQLKKNSKSQTKNLEQLVELTKRFYVEKKAEQLADKLKDLGDKEEKLSESDKNSAEKQEDIKRDFDQIKEELRELEKQNEDLKKPMDIPTDKNEEKSVEEDMKKASDELKKESKDSKQKAKPKQKSAAQKMKEMGGKMMEGMMSGDMEQMEEDVKMLRQILDNLLAYSFSQEDVMGKFKGSTTHSASFGKNLKKQQDLKQQFRHVDDSIFAISLRNPKITEQVTAEVGNVHYYTDKAIADLAENLVPRGVSNQQYAITAANKLADFLSDTLNNMQMEMSGSGGSGDPKPGKSGKGDMQLPDIIQKQEKLAKKMQEGKEGKDGKKGEGKEGEPKPGGKEKGKGQGEGEGEDGDNEGDAGEILEIYKEQQQLREALQKALEKEGMGGNGQNAARQMKEIEKQLLNKGFKGDAMQKMQNLKHELLKLDKAIQQQGEENKRQSQTNTKEFSNSANRIPDALKEYLNSVEILNRQSLPLRPNFNQRVQAYFRKDD
ncbi:glutamyl-tRNA synthetase [Flavobacterium psychrophilum]|nr:glutamyl-tRNA synthetase [Flavobacterium psychrophilum]AOE52852.1 glutamyl-tRNA synthetase [Flavobacterium psychrophilum]